MSSENIHITRHNYEEYFLLYVDNELSAAERMAVEDFVASHPDLREELDILLQTTVLGIPAASLGDKSFLMADTMKVTAVEDSLLLYLDNELTGSEKTRVEEMMKTDAGCRLQYDLLLRTKLEKENIVYPNKAELYRRSERAVGLYWLRAAAAVIVFAATGLIYFLNGDGTTKPDNNVLVEQVKPKSTQSEEQHVAAITPEEKIPVTKESSAGLSKAVSVPVRQAAVQQTGNEDIAYIISDTPFDPVRNGKTETVKNDPKTEVTDPKTEVVVTPKHNINTRIVTETDPHTSETKEDDIVAIPKDVADDQKGSVRGLLRKATRFVEKRTGINPVNDDDELLIGVVAIKLK